MKSTTLFIVACLALAGPLSAVGVGRAAPAFTLPSSHVEARHLADLKGKVVFINFWASWCAPCQVELPQLNRLAREYKGRSVRVLAINVDSDRAVARSLLKKLGIAAPLEVLWDRQSKVVGTYNIESMPSSFIVDQKGIVRFVHVGYRDEDVQVWRNELNQLLAKTAN